ncbi:hypothetical protein GCM10009784_12470 [Arthrobacter parietis]|uniref:Uncharacterized protein n=1 Tax=Arthrobacter parietis TaxID=271434 RepID=A0ABN3ASS8_9MICC
MRDELAGLPGTNGGQAGDEIREGVVGHCQQDKLRPFHDLLDPKQRDPGQEVLGPFPACFGDSGNSDDGVFGCTQGSTQNGTNPACADHSDAEPPGFPAGASSAGTDRTLSNVHDVDLPGMRAVSA